MRHILIIIMLVATLNAQKREALLIGNYSYSEIENLNNPTSKLNELKRTLKGIGFHSTIQTNLDSIHLEEAIDKFINRLSRSSDSVGFLYYSGHGCQLDYQGYLIPTNVDTTQKLQIKYKALNINALLDKFRDAHNSVNMIFLDACRNVATGARGGTKGLAQPSNTPNRTMVVYATKAGYTADDNSKFIDALIDNINKPNLTIRDIGDNISNQVFRESGQKQTPVVYSVLLPSRMVLKRGDIQPPVSKWIAPTDGVCRSNGGKIDKDGVCKANWENAKKICSASGGRLPTIDELREVIVDCGGEMKENNYAEMKKNEKNTSYQSCYKKKGFSSSSDCWSATTNASYSSDAWNVNFFNGDHRWYSKTLVSSIRCVRGGQ